MKPTKISITAVALASGLLFNIFHITRAYADDGHRHNRVCSEKTLRGSYGFYRTGTTTTIGPLAGVGLIFFDGKGNFDATQKIVRNGDVNAPDATFSGTYEVVEDCTGKAFFQNVEFVRMVIVDGGKEIYQLSVTPGNTVYLVGKKIHTHDDD